MEGVEKWNSNKSLLTHGHFYHKHFHQFYHFRELCNFNKYLSNYENLKLYNFFTGGEDLKIYETP